MRGDRILCEKFRRSWLLEFFFLFFMVELSISPFGMTSHLFIYLGGSLVSKSKIVKARSDGPTEVLPVPRSAMDVREILHND